MKVAPMLELLEGVLYKCRNLKSGTGLSLTSNYDADFWPYGCHFPPEFMGGCK